MASTAVIGTLVAKLTADTAQFEGGMQRATKATQATEKALAKTGTEVAKLAPQAERMVKAFQGDKLLYQANNMVAAVAKVGGAAKLTTSEQAKVNATVTQAIEKYKALGQQAPAALTALHNATKPAAESTSFLSTKMVAVAAAVGTFAGALAMQGVRSLVSFGKEAFESAGHILDLEAKTGLSTDTIQRMQFVADQTGGSLESMADAAYKLGIRLAGGGNSVVQAVEDLGLNFAELKQQRPDQQFETIASALGEMTDAQERNRIGTELFGKSFSGIAASIAQGYGTIADAANQSTRAQLAALDKAGDRWDQFVTNTKTNVRSLLGSVLQAYDTVNNLRDRSLAIQFGTQDQRASLSQPGDIALSTQATAAALSAQVSYAAQLKKVRAELDGLTAAQRKEIEAAQQLGVSTDDLEEKFGLSAGSLKLLTTETKENTKGLKSAADAATKAEEAYRGFTNWIGERAIEDVQRFNEALADLSNREHDTSFNVPSGMGPMPDEIAAWGKYWDAREKQADDYRGFLNEVGEREKADEEARQKRFAAVVQQAYDQAQYRVDMFTYAVSDGFASMLVGARGFKDGFLDVWHGIQRAIGTILSDILHDFLTRFLGGLIRGIAGAKLGQALGGSFASGGGGGGGGMGGGLANMAIQQGISRFAGGAAATSLAGGAASSVGGAVAVGNTVYGTGLAGVGAASAGGGAAATAGGGGTAAAVGGGIGMGAAIGLTAGIGAAALLAWAIWKKGLFRGGEESLKVNGPRDQFLMANWGGSSAAEAGQRFAAWASKATGEPNGSHFYPMLQSADSVKEFKAAEQAIAAFGKTHGKPNIKLFNNGGFIPPGAVQPAILHGGAMGEIVAPVAKLQGMGSVHNTYVTVQGVIDGTTFGGLMRSYGFREIKTGVFHNTDGLTTDLTRAVNRTGRR
jgi:hypothetical protein